MTDHIVKLPKDGAVYECTYTVDGERCNKVTTVGIDRPTWEAALAHGGTRYGNVSFMRALCPTHIPLVVKLVFPKST